MQHSAFARSVYSQNKPKSQFTSCSHYMSAPVFGGGPDPHDFSFWDPRRTILCVVHDILLVKGESKHTSKKHNDPYKGLLTAVI